MTYGLLKKNMVLQEIIQIKMPSKKISRNAALTEINDFFDHIEHKTSEQVKKIKKLAMSHNIKLGHKRKLFCKKCLNPFRNSSITIKNDFVTIECESCGHKNRWKFQGRIRTGVKVENAECC